MIERFDSDTNALGNRFNVVLQCGFGVRMTQVCLDVLDGRDWSHICRTRPSEDLVRHAGDPGLFASFLQDPEKEIVGIDGGSCRRRLVPLGRRKFRFR